MTPLLCAGLAAFLLGLVFVLAAMLFYRDQPSPDPEGDIHGDVPHVGER